MPQARQGNVSQLAPPKYFKVKKYLLVVIIVLNIFALALAIFSLDKFAQIVINLNSKNLSSDQLQEAKSTTKGFLFGVCITGILVDLLFLYGIVKESIGLSIGYAILAIIGTIILAIGTLSNPLIGLQAIFCALVAIVAMLYVLDLGRFRQINQRMYCNAAI